MSKSKMQRNNLGNRMKSFYEEISKTKLMRRTPAVIRVDGKSFHTFTKGFHKPFDDIMVKTMQETSKYLCENIQGCVLGYCQSDEISLVLIDYQTFETSAWFDYEVQKMCSVAAAMTTLAFHNFFAENVGALVDRIYESGDQEPFFKYESYLNILYQACRKGALFDARVFSIPKEEVANYFYWRQLDAIRNSIQMAGQANFSHRELQNKSCKEIQELLVRERQIDWNDYPACLKWGSCAVKVMLEDGTRARWELDQKIPIFKEEGRAYIERLIYIEE